MESRGQDVRRPYEIEGQVAWSVQNRFSKRIAVAGSHRQGPHFISEPELAFRRHGQDLPGGTCTPIEQRTEEQRLLAPWGMALIALDLKCLFLTEYSQMKEARIVSSLTTEQTVAKLLSSYGVNRIFPSFQIATTRDWPGAPDWPVPVIITLSILP